MKTRFILLITVFFCVLRLGFARLIRFTRFSFAETRFACFNSVEACGFQAALAIQNDSKTE